MCTQGAWHVCWGIRTGKGSVREELPRDPRPTPDLFPLPPNYANRPSQALGRHTGAGALGSRCVCPGFPAQETVAECP